MKEYEDKKYQDWVESVQSVLSGYLKKNLLTLPSAITAPQGKVFFLNLIIPDDVVSCHDIM